MTDLRIFFDAGGIEPALVVAIVSFFSGASLLALGDLFRALPEIAINTRVLAYKSREGSNYPALRVIGFLATLSSIAAFVGGGVGVVVLLMRGG